MIEYDTDAYRRKWCGTTGMALVNGDMLPVYYHDIVPREDKDGSIYAACIPHFDRNNLWGINKKGDCIGLIEPLYYPFEAGIYLSKKQKGITIFERAHRKTFNVGLVPGSNVYLRSYDEKGNPTKHPPLTDLDFLDPLPSVKVKEDGAGYLDRRWWYNKNQLYYLGAQLGFKEGKRFIVSRQEYIPFLSPLLDRECQIRAL